MLIDFKGIAAHVLFSSTAFIFNWGTYWGWMRGNVKIYHILKFYPEAKQDLFLQLLPFKESSCFFLLWSYFIFQYS